ncbi:MAG: alpha/beta hydrolase [Bdellovibrionaceae bacterium]|nr:alpha/beta hydrolase [Pseudobdellovibrionaceae bacterium]MBX3034540.1 alpha/beta hydrolase [Pseudobdellovibrionaceae bacterium]
MALLELNDGSGARLHYEVRDGLVPENILFIHGNLASNAWWKPAEPFWAASSRGTDPGALVYGEFRGCGGSSDPRSAADVDMHLFARDFIQLVRHLNRGRFHLVGHSTGGLIAALMMAMEPSLFDRAVLVDPVGARGVRFDDSMIGAFERMKSDRGMTAAVLGATIHGHDPASDFFQKFVVEDAQRAVKAVGHWVLRALDGLDARAEMAKITSPVLVLHGEHDQLLPVEDSRELASLIPQGRFEMLAGQGHCPNIENPESFVAVTRQFLMTR